jgi:hypothetical protein
MAEIRTVGWREVLIVAAIAVAAVLAAQVIATLVPPIGDVIRATPVIVVLMVVVTALVLWRIAAPRPPEPPQR